MSLGSSHPRWNGGRRRIKGYIAVYMPGHPRAHHNAVLEHILIAEQMYGGPLPPEAEVHHINGIRDDNRPENLMICKNFQEHRLIHTREDARKACGNPDWRKCCYCHQYADTGTMKKHRRAYYHQQCRRERDHRTKETRHENRIYRSGWYRENYPG